MDIPVWLHNFAGEPADKEDDYMPRLYGKLDPFTAADYKKLQDATLHLLEHTGVLVNSLDMLAYAKQAGYRVDFDKRIVRFPPELVDYNLHHCPGSLDRRPAPQNLIFSCDGGGGSVFDYDRHSIRPATVQDIADFSRLADAMENVDEISFPCFDPSVPYEVQDLTIFRQVWANTAKTGGGGLSRNDGIWMNTQPRAVELFIRMAKVRYGGDTKPDGKPVAACFVGAASPLRFERDMMDVALLLLKEKQTVGIGSNVIGGIQSPVTLAGLVVMEHAERLAAMSLLLAVDRNASFYFCNHPNFLDMVSMNVSNGSAEHHLAAMCATGLLRYNGFQLYANHPVMSTGAHYPDQQAAVEKALGALVAGLSGASGICTCGSLYECMSYEQLVIDNEIAGMVRHYLKGLDITDETIALEAMEEMGIGGNFLEHESVAENCRDVYWMPRLFNRKRYSEWILQNGKTAIENAHDIVLQTLATHHPKPLTDDQIRQMDEIVEEGYKTLVK